jgi:hypothetical protein
MTARAPLSIREDTKPPSADSISQHPAPHAERQTLAELTEWHAAGKLR